MLIDSTISALAIVFDPERFAIISLGVFLGLIIGVLPGIGGLAGMALLISFTYAMDPHTALAFLIGMWAVTATSDTVPAILFGVPGAIGSASTCPRWLSDGAARRGEAGRAFGASFTASVLGGLFSAILLAISFPVLRPFTLAIGSPELLAMCVLGLTLVASISQGAVLKGLVTATFGVLIAAIGNEAQTGALRWTLGTMYLWDGIPIETIALGLLGGVHIIGMMPALGLSMILYMVIQGRTRWITAIAIALPLWVGMYVLFVKLLHVPWPPSLLGDAFPALRLALKRLILTKRALCDYPRTVPHHFQESFAKVFASSMEKGACLYRNPHAAMISFLSV